GSGVVSPPGQPCCGQPAFNSGYSEEARSVARRQISLFPEPFPIVVPSGSCAAMMRRHYHTLFQGHPLAARAEAFAARVVELTEFLSDVLEVSLTDRGAPATVTSHPSSHPMRH